MGEGGFGKGGGKKGGKPFTLANTIIYSTLIKGCAKEGNAEAALKLYGEMKTEGVLANRVTFNS